MIGLCAPDIASLGKLNAANGDKFVAGGYDLTEPNLQAIKDGHAYVTIGQSAFVQGYLPIALLVELDQEQASRSRSGSTMPARRSSPPTSVDMGNGLPAITFDEAIAARRRPGRDRRILQALDGEADGRTLTAGMQPIAAEAE